MKEWKERCWAQVDLGAVRRNYRRLRSLLAPEVKYLAVVKAGAYGHGAAPVALALEEEGADWFGAATLEEGEALRRAGVCRPILIFGYTPPQDAGRISAAGLTQGVFSLEYASALEEAAGAAGCRVEIHLMVDRGMNRLGLCPGEPGALEAAGKILSMAHLRCTGTFTHFAVADELSTQSLGFTRRQFEQFREFCAALRARGLDPGLLHCANSAAALLHPEMQLGMCRFGIVSYGLMPSDDLAGRLALEPTISFHAAVAMVKTVEHGATVSYGRIYTARGRRRIATVAAGYADGYPRELGNRGRVLIRGRFAPVAGRVCMDQFMVDVTHIPGVKMGDTVTLAGRDGDNLLPWEELARLTGTIPYERICAISGRVPRVYTE